MNRFLKSKCLYVLFLLPFIILAIVWIRICVLNISMHPLQIGGCVDFSFINDFGGWWGIFLSAIVLLSGAYVIFFLNAKYKLLNHSTSLPSLLYVLLALEGVLTMEFNNLLLSSFFIVLAIERLQTAIFVAKNNESLYSFGAWVMLGVLVYPKLALLILWAICVLFFSARSSLKDSLTLFLGMSTPLLFIGFYYFWTDQLTLLPDLFLKNLLSGGYISTFSLAEYLNLGVLSLIWIIALFHLSTHYSIMVVNQRRGLLSLVSMSFFLLASFFLIPGFKDSFVYIMALPLSFIYAYYFITNKIVLLGNLLFILLLVMCCFSYFIF